MALLFYHVPPVLPGKSLKQTGSEYNASKNMVKYFCTSKYFEGKKEKYFYFNPADAIFDLGTESVVYQT